MKITIEQESCTDAGESYTRKFSLETSDNLDIYEIMEEFKRILMMMTFLPETIDKYFKEEDKGIALS